MRVEVLVEGMLSGRFIRERFSLDVPERSRVRDVARALHGRIGLDLLSREGTGTVAMLDGERLDLPADAERPVSAGVLLAILSPLAGG